MLISRTDCELEPMPALSARLSYLTRISPRSMRPAEAVDRLGRPVTCSPCADGGRANDDQNTFAPFRESGGQTLCSGGLPLERPLQSYAGGRGESEQNCSVSSTESAIRPCLGARHRTHADLTELQVGPGDSVS